MLLDSGVDLSSLFDQGGLLNQLSKCLVEKALASEMDNHLGYNKYARSDSEHARNGLSSKQIITDNDVKLLTQYEGKTLANHVNFS
ncbi:transposase [Candidatus Cardinium sp. TP]|uniref:transposase n=1 Tax=Candidatus Cardinium sp. TP TaxID=2961955 RepID=UPI0021AF696E|nr:transposase [Candidatus Cardinium sp. TP]MCT4696900.1 transposase [Candidatus Cardinium sp. TP]